MELTPQFLPHFKGLDIVAYREVGDKHVEVAYEHNWREPIDWAAFNYAFGSEGSLARYREVGFIKPSAGWNFMEDNNDKD